MIVLCPRIKWFLLGVMQLFFVASCTHSFKTLADFERLTLKVVPLLLGILFILPRVAIGTTEVLPTLVTVHKS